MVNDMVGRIAEAVPFMTGQYRDSLAKKSPVFSELSIADPAPEAVAPGVNPSGKEAAPSALPSQTSTAPADLRQLFASLPVVAPAAAGIEMPETPFVPTFRKATGSDGIQTWEVNSTYFASVETAQWIATKYGTGEVVEVPFGGVGGIFSASANEYHIKLVDGRLVNAGILAGYYERNPPNRFPGLADKLIRGQLGLA